MATTTPFQQILSKEDCAKILRRSVNQPATFVSYKIKNFCENVAGFLGEHFKLTIKFTINNTPLQKSFFVKALPQSNLSQLEYVQESGVFKKEVILYKNLLSELLKINHFGPRCYFVKDDCIVLEDLSALGYRMSQKQDYLDETRCISMLKTLGKYHASSLIYENQRGVKLNEKFLEEVKETTFSFVEGEPRQKWCVSSTRCVTDLMKLLPEIENSQKIGEKFHRFVFEDLEKMLKPSDRFANVLTHDDLWCNNMLINDKLEYIFVDFQLVRYTPPALDLLVTLFLNLETDYFLDNFKKFTGIYYSILDKELKKHELNIEVLIPKSKYEESLQYYMLPALTEVVMYGTHIFVSQELLDYVVTDFETYNEFSFINRSKYAVKEFKENPQFRDRMHKILLQLAKTLETRD